MKIVKILSFIFSISLSFILGLYISITLKGGSIPEYHWALIISLLVYFSVLTLKTQTKNESESRKIN